MNNQGKVAEKAADAIVSPSRFAHVVLRSGRYAEMVHWYKTVLNAQVAFENEDLTFLRYDEEHHRVAILNMPNLEDAPGKIAGVHHFAFTYDNLRDLLENYERLKDRDISPVLCINHGPTTSLYYADPDQNQIEFQFDNFDTVEEAGEFFYTEAFAKNPIGVEFDPDELVRRFRAGESIETLCKRPDIGVQTLADVKKLR